MSAGEVVERPASVVKELVENSIDAGAQNITISIKSGGGKEIAITDDGCGIDEKNLKKCCLPHATSKLSSPSDLQKICTLGFRGEALPSICAVAQVYISSKTEQQTLGNFIRNHGGVEVESGQIGQSTGTTVVVSNLFFNIPVRAKFLKNDKQEQSYVTTIVQQLIFANPQIKIKYIADGKTLLHSNGDLESCIYTIYGNDIANQMIFFDSEFSDIKVCGYCGNRFCSKNNRTFQIIVVNGRAIVDANIQVAVAQAYGNSLMKRQYPIFAISIELPFDEVDVNVHPSKNQVRFQDNHKIFSCVYKAISLALAKNESVAMFSNNSNEKNVFFDNNSNVAIQKVSEDIVKKFENNIENCVQNNNENDTKSSKILQSEAVPTDFANSAHGKFLDNSSLIKNEYQSSLSAHQKSNMLSDNKNCNNDNDSDNIDKNNNDEINFCDNIDIKENEKINKLISQQQEKINDCSVEKNLAVSKVSNTLSQTIGGSIFEHGASFDNVFNDSKTNFQKEVDKEVDNIFEQIELSLQDEITIVGQIFKTYLIVQKNDKAYLVDQHACHERILYDQLILQIETV
ncbi:MAG: DNA mismatch repair endonuclease MutL, partial [Clostridia bacterium]